MPLSTCRRNEPPGGSTRATRERTDTGLRPSAMRSISIALCLVASVSFAQKTEPAPRPKVQTVTFSETGIGGDREVPLGEYYGIPPAPKFLRLFKVRVNFNDKLQESVHEM